ncbi:hypothetical protein BC834DRAFT_852101 [Gloeopeniophorella convolvens]|nr:hypothetical protein BC834DRAFT_852101 [Gloeopeniophorella convolvens]
MGRDRGRMQTTSVRPRLDHAPHVQSDYPSNTTHPVVPLAAPCNSTGRPLKSDLCNSVYIPHTRYV